MAEFARLQLIVGEDFTKSLLALRSDLEASCEALVSNIVRTIALHPNDPAAHQVKAALKTFQQSTSMKVTLSLMQLEAARGDMEEFMRSTLPEAGRSHQPGARAGPSSGTHRGRGVSASHNRTRGPSTPRGQLLPRHAGRVSRVTWFGASWCN